MDAGRIGIAPLRGVGLAREPAGPEIALILLMLAAVSFDGLRRPAWAAITDTSAR
jgi:hypothetical protein